MKKTIILMTLFILFPISCKALNCSYAEQAKLRKLASSVTASYDYVEENDNVTFNVTLTNITDEMYIRDTIKNIDYHFNGSSEITINGYDAGTNVKYLIYPTKEGCTVSYLASKYVNLPYYNKYYKDALCEGKNYSICSKWQKVTLSYDEFVKTINEYDKKNDNKEEEIKEENDNIFDLISKFIFDYYIYILGGGLLIFILISLLTRKKDDFDL